MKRREVHQSGGGKRSIKTPPARALHGLQYWPFRWMDLKQTGVQTQTAGTLQVSLLLSASALLPRQVVWSLIHRWGSQETQPAMLKEGLESVPHPYGYSQGCDPHRGWSHTHPLSASSSWLPVIWVSGCLKFYIPCSVCEVWLWEEPHRLWFVDEEDRPSPSLGCRLVGWDSKPSIRTISGPEFEPWFHHLITAAFDKLLSLSGPPLPNISSLCEDGSPLGSPVPGILQARTLKCVTISFSSAWKWKVKVKSLSRVQLFANPWTVAYPASPSTGFPRQEYWSQLPVPSPP